MLNRTMTLAAILLVLCFQAAAADEIGRPDPRPAPLEDGRPVLNMIGAGLLGAGLAALIPVQLGVAIATRGGESRRAPAPGSALRLSPWLAPRQQGLVVSGAF